MLEVFNLDGSFKDTIEQVLAACADTQREKYSLRPRGGAQKPQQAKPTLEEARQAVR